IESSCWDKEPPEERSPQHGQHWRARDHGAPGCGPHQLTATACPTPGLWTTPAHSHCMPHTRAVDHPSSQPLHAPHQVWPWSPLVRGPWHNKNSPQDSWTTWVCPHRTLKLHSAGCFPSRAWSCSLYISPSTRARHPNPGFCGSPSFRPSPCHPSWSHHTQPMSIGGLRGRLHLPRSGTTAPPKYLQTLSSPASHQ
uniref:Uncharacterized protein n=1 Tax=Saimiri boliviensis boliviensis TaxID=39432 RepID=A0A2K6UR60_SAIBB